MTISPLNAFMPMVSPDTGLPHPQFIRYWQEQIATNATIPDLSTAASVSGILDKLGTTRGSILYRSTSLWTALIPGTATYVLKTGGAGADPAWGQIAEVELTFTDVTTNNASVSQHGFLPKLSGTLTQFLDGGGNWDTVKDSDLETSDITTNNADVTKHGFLPKLSGVTTNFLDGGGNWDTVKDEDLTTSDVTTNDVSISKHGFAPKAPNDTSQFLRGDGTWAAPPAADVTIIREAGANRNLSDTDLAGGRVIFMDNASNPTVTIADTLTGTEPVRIINAGGGTIEFVESGTGVVLNYDSGNQYLAGQHHGVLIIPEGSDEYTILYTDSNTAPSIGAHRYWRIFVDENYNDTFLSIQEIEMRESVSGADVTSTAFTISGGDRGASWQDDYAFDNNAANSWSILRSAGASNMWIGQDFGMGNEKEILEVVMTARNDFSSGYASLHMPAKWRLQYSDDNISYTDVWTYTREAPWELGESRTYSADEPAAPSGAYTHWRLHAGFAHVSGFFSVAEIEMATSAAGSNDATTGQSIYGAQRTGFEATKAFDGIVSGNNSWSITTSGSNPVDNNWAGQDFGTASYDLFEIRVTARADSFSSHAPMSFAVEVSDDGVSWDVAWVETDIPTWSAALQRTYVRP